MAGEFVSNRKLNAPITGGRRNPMNQTVAADGKLAEKEASPVHVRFALVLGIGGLEFPKLVWRRRKTIEFTMI